MPTPHNRVIIGFVNEDGQAASMTLSVAGTALVTSQTGLSAWAIAIAANIVSSIGVNLTGLMDAATSIVSVKCTYNTGKLQITAATALLSTPKVGTGTTPLPAQVSCVFSLLTAFTGRSYRGRVYWPATGAAISTGGTFTVTLSTLLGQFQLFINGQILAASGAPTSAYLCIYSPHLDIINRVSAIRVGNVPDIQRRRRQRVETVYSQPL